MYIYININTYVMGRKKLEPTFKKCITCENEFNPGKHKEKLNCSIDCLKLYQIKHKEDRMKKSFDAIEKKYGVRNFPQTPGFSNKVKKTKKEKYGNENYNNYEKTKLTNKKKYNVEHGLQYELIREKGRETKKEKYNDKNLIHELTNEKYLKESFGDYTNTTNNEHPNTEAHKIWADYLYEKIIELNYYTKTII